MANATCRGCTEQGWLGLRDGVDGPRYHERSVAGPDGGGQLEMIPCVAHLKKPKKVTTWRNRARWRPAATAMSASVTSMNKRSFGNQKPKPGGARGTE